MKSKNTQSIAELIEKYNKIKRSEKIVMILAILSFILLLILTFTSSSIKYLFLNIYLMPLLFLIFISFLYYFITLPDLSSYERIRYNLTKSIEFLKSENYSKTEYHLNKIAINLEYLLEELEGIDILCDFRNVLDNFLLKLKLDVYPNISNAEKSEELTKLLRDLQKALIDQNQINLARLSKNLIDENPRNIELPYEKPNKIDKFLKLIVNNDQVKFIIKFIVAFIIITSLIIVVGNEALQFFNIEPNMFSMFGFIAFGWKFTDKFIK